MLRISIITLLYLGSYSGSYLMSQFNFQIGYQFSYSVFSGINSSISHYNEANPALSRKMEDLKGLHAISLGLRQGLGKISMLGSWTNQVDRLHADGIQALSPDPDFLREMFLKNQILSLGLESLAGVFGAGASLDYRLLTVRNRDSGSESKQLIWSEKLPGSTLWIFYDLPVSSRMAIVLKASYGFPWKSIGLQPLNRFLLNSGEAGSDAFRQWGVSLIFSNGRQPRY